jgi:serine/threonine protein kinase/tetratricopeptide (TPR) repeat protein
MEKTISHYEILGKIGEGGMGVVYKARDVRLGRVVALKFLPASLADSEALAGRFEDEARAISALNHPNIATIFELDAGGAERFLALEFLPGGTLHALLKHRRTAGDPLPFDKIVEYAWQIAEGLAHAHAHGIIHRDIKADNVMLTAEGTLKITDFGLAKLRDSGGRTSAGHVVGTAACMSPEQAYGTEVDHRTDIFSYGVLLYQLATLDLPFHGSNALAVVQEVYSKPAPPISQTRTGLPASFQHIVDKAMVKDRERRYQSMEEVLRDLQAVGGSKISVRVISRVTEQSPTLTLVSPLSTELRKRTRRRRTFLWAGAAVLAAGMISGAFLWRRTVRLNEERHIAVLPFVNIGGDRETQALCDGLVETLTASLGQLQRFQDALWVTPSSEIRQQPVANASAAHQVFGATLVVTGSLQRNGDRLRLIASLVDAVKRRQIASRTIDTSIAHITEIQDTMADRVAEMLALNLNPEMRRALAAGRTTVPAAYEAYAKGLAYLQGRRPEDFALAGGLFEVAVQKDATYALAYAALGSANLGKYSFSHDQRFLEEARTACRRAVELNSELPEARLAMAQLYSRTGKFEDAVEELNRLIAIDRTSADAYYMLAETYNTMGRLADAEATYKRAIQMRPGHWAGYNALGRFYALHGRYEDAEQNFRMVTTLTPDNVMGYNNLGGMYNKWGHYVDAVAALQKSLSLKPSAPGYSNLGTILYFLGRYDEAVPNMAKAVELAPARYTFWGNYGDACRWSSGSRDRAAPAYRQAIALVVKELAVHPTDSMLLASEGLYYAKLGEMAPALAGIGKALQQKPLDMAVYFKAGIVYELAGQRERALTELESALKAGYSAEEITKERELERLRSDPRFPKLIAASVPAPSPKQ